MRQFLTDLMLVTFVVLMIAAIPFALSPDNPLGQRPQPLANPDVNLTLDALWATFLAVALGAPVISALAGMDDQSNSATPSAERVEKHHED